MKAYHSTISVIVVADNEKEARNILLMQMQKFTNKTMQKTAIFFFLEEKNMKDLYLIGLAQKCEVEDCQRYFVPNPSGKEQRFCSNACKQKAYRKRAKRRIRNE